MLSRIGERAWRLSRATLVLTTVASIILALFPFTASASSPPTQIANINPGYQVGDGIGGATLNGYHYFSASDGTHGAELWRTDGTSAGTTMVDDINAGSGGSYPLYITNFNGTLYFSADDGAGTELWTSDGTAAGTSMVSDFYPGAPPGTSNVVISTAGNSLCVNGSTYIYDGTTQCPPIGSVSTGDKYFYETADHKLWVGDSTGEHTVDDGISLAEPSSHLTAVSGKVFFGGYEAADPSQIGLWISDGTVSGTQEISPYYPTGGQYFGGGGELSSINGTVFYSADDGIHGNQLWKSDGTTSGTTMVTTGTPFAYTGTLVVNGLLAFTGCSALCINDGTAAGTTKIFPNTGSSSVGLVGAIGSILLFWNSDSSGHHLWAYNTAQLPASPTNLTIPSPTTVPSLSWDSVSGADHYNVYRDGSLIDSSSFNTYTDSGSMADGDHTYAVTAVDLLGAESPQSGSVTVLVDKTAPTIGNASWSSNPVALGTDATLTVPASDATSGVTSGEYYVGTDPGVGNATVMSYSGGNLTATFGSSLGVGVYPVGVRAKDAAGNWSSTTTTMLVVFDPNLTLSITGKNKKDLVPSLAAGDVLPGLISSTQTDGADYGMTVQYKNGTLDPHNDFMFTYNTGTNCGKPNPQNCHSFVLNVSSFAWILVNGTGNSQGQFQGTAALTIDGVTTTNPFTVSGLDGDNLTPAQNDTLVLKVFAPGADPSTATPIYQASGSMAKGNSVVIK